MERIAKLDDGKWWVVDWSDMMPLAGPFDSRQAAVDHRAQFDTLEDVRAERMKVG